MSRVEAIFGHQFGGAAAAEKYQMASLVETPVNKDVLAVARAFKSSSPRPNLYISGPTGCGKTHVATAMIQDVQGRVLKPYQILRAARAVMAVDGMTEGDVTGVFLGRKLWTPEMFLPPVSDFALDDLGTEKLTEWAESILFELFDSRLSYGMGGMVVTSNLSLDELAGRMGSDRVPSRIAGAFKVFNLSGEKDYRVCSPGGAR